MTDETRERPDARGSSIAAEISNAIVRLLHDYTGRGPTRAQTYVHRDLVICLLEDTLTKGERVLAEHGEGNHVRSHRSAFKDAMRQEAKAVIERLTGRRVVAFLGDNHVDPDVAIEAFVLERSDGGLPGGRSDRATDAVGADFRTPRPDEGSAP